MGRGPHALLGAGLVERLANEGVTATLVEIEPEEVFAAEIAMAFDLQRGVRRAVEASLAMGRRAISLTGNCNTGVIGSLAAHAGSDIGLVWFDAHSDAATPDSSTSGFLDGMGLAMALGCCWTTMLREVGASKLDGRRAALVGAREIEPAAGRLLEDQGVAIVTPEDARLGHIGPPLDRLRSAGVRQVHLHVDLDVLDSERVGPASSYALGDGVSEVELLRLIEQVQSAFPTASASIASYDPEVDTSGAVASAGLEVAARLAHG